MTVAPLAKWPVLFGPLLLGLVPRVWGVEEVAGLSLGVLLPVPLVAAAELTLPLPLLPLWALIGAAGEGVAGYVRLRMVWLVLSEQHVRRVVHLLVLA